MMTKKYLIDSLIATPKRLSVKVEDDKIELKEGTKKDLKDIAKLLEI